MNKDLTRGPVMRSMLWFALPMILGNLLQQCYNIADTLIVGRFLGKTALAAVGSSFFADDNFLNIDLAWAVHGQRCAVFHPLRAAR